MWVCLCYWIVWMFWHWRRGKKPCQLQWTNVSKNNWQNVSKLTVQTQIYTFLDISVLTEISCWSLMEWKNLWSMYIYISPSPQHGSWLLTEQACQSMPLESAAVLCSNHKMQSYTDWQIMGFGSLKLFSNSPKHLHMQYGMNDSAVSRKLCKEDCS